MNINIKICFNPKLFWGFKLSKTVWGFNFETPNHTTIKRETNMNIKIFLNPNFFGVSSFKFQPQTTLEFQISIPNYFGISTSPKQKHKIIWVSV